MDKAVMKFERASASLLPWYITHWRGKDRPIKYHSLMIIKQEPEKLKYEYRIAGRRTIVKSTHVFKHPKLGDLFVNPSAIFPGICDNTKSDLHKNVLWLPIPWGSIYHPKTLSTTNDLYTLVKQIRDFYQRCATNYSLVKLDFIAINPNVTKRNLLQFLSLSLKDAPYDIKYLMMKYGTDKCRKELYRVLQLPKLAPHIRDLQQALHSFEEQKKHPENAKIYKRVYEDLLNVGYKFGIFPKIECDSWKQYERETCDAVRLYLKDECTDPPVDDVLLHISKYLSFKMETMMTMTHKSLNNNSVKAAIYHLIRYDPKILDEAVYILTSNENPRIVHTNIARYMNVDFISTDFTKNMMRITSYPHWSEYKSKHTPSKLKAYDIFTQEWQSASVAVARLIIDPVLKFHRFRFFFPKDLTEEHINRYFNFASEVEPTYPPQGPLQPVELLNSHYGCFILRNAAAYDHFLTLLQKHSISFQTQLNL